ncbi:MAG: AAA-like domain-containing protein [Leptolyngbyaceae cyanobacterium MO_188.B28]|nr:AAA-like domain-containing protein [Leptolyngbyaceae cyanobacterium MO_188.B28]
MSFGIEEAIQTANQLAYRQANRYLTDVEILVLRGAWDKLEYDQIAAQNEYSTSYISKDAAPKLWKLLSSSLGEKVRKSNFKEALKRSWEESRTVSAGCSEIPDSEARNPRITSSKKIDYLESNPTENPILCNVYIERPPVESICCKALTQPGALIRIKAPKFMGKTSLANYLSAELSASTYRTVNLSFELADRYTHLTDLNKFLRWMCLNISREMDLPSQIDEIWDEDGIGAKVSCTAYFEDYLLTQSDTPLILCLDDVDLLFPHPEVYEDFFGLLRSWYEKGKTRRIWKKLRLMVVHATDVYIRLNINQSPFNVGLAIELPEFSTEQAQDFAQQSGLREEDAQVEALMNWVGGHPYLLKQAFSYLKSHPMVTLASLLSEENTIFAVYQNHLREQWMTLQEKPQLAAAFNQVVRSSQPVELDPMLTYQLQSMGLVKAVSHGVVTRCRLYEEYFKKHLG